MSAVIVESELYKRIEEAAREYQTEVSELFAEAIRRYLWELDRQKIARESQTFRERHAELKAKYLNQYIAMHDGRLVDSDDDFPALRQRIRQRFGRTPVMMTRVEETVEHPVVRHGFRLEANDRDFIQDG